MKYKMLVLDLDGTLTNNYKEITPRTKEALMQAQAKGVRVVLASGRPTYGITPIANELMLTSHGGFILAFNGGKIIDYTSRETVFEQTIGKPEVEALYNAAEKAGLAILTYQDYGIVTTQKDNNYVEHEAFINKLPVTQCDNFVEDLQYPINKCLIVGDPTPLHELELQLSKDLFGQVEVYRSAGFFLECVPPGVDKAKSLERLLAMVNIDKDDVIAVGDGFNDLSMIEYAGLGIAMDNAPGEVKSRANFFTSSNDEDGVAKVIEKFILEMDVEE